MIMIYKTLLITAYREPAKRFLLDTPNCARKWLVAISWTADLRSYSNYVFYCLLQRCKSLMKGFWENVPKLPIFDTKRNLTVFIFVLLWYPNFIKQIGKNFFLRYSKTDRQTERQTSGLTTDMGDYIGPSRVNPRTKYWNL